jgi:hypothetical protein
MPIASINIILRHAPSETCVRFPAQTHPKQPRFDLSVRRFTQIAAVGAVMSPRTAVGAAASRDLLLDCRFAVALAANFSYQSDLFPEMCWSISCRGWRARDCWNILKPSISIVSERLWPRLDETSISSGSVRPAFMGSSRSPWKSYAGCYCSSTVSRGATPVLVTDVTIPTMCAHNRRLTGSLLSTPVAPLREKSTADLWKELSTEPERKTAVTSRVPAVPARSTSAAVVVER